MQVEATKEVAPPEVVEPEMPEENEPLGIVEEIGDALEPWKLDDFYICLEYKWRVGGTSYRHLKLISLEVYKPISL